jgi:hypothetical protein
VIQQGDPRDDFERARRLYQQYQQSRASGTPFRPDPADVEAVRRTKARYEAFRSQPKPAAPPAAEEEGPGLLDSFARGPRELLDRTKREIGALQETGGHLLLGAGETFTNMGEGIGRLAGWEGLEEGAEAAQAALQERFDPDQDAGFLSGRGAGRLLTEGATAMLGGGLITKGLSKLPATAGLAARLRAMQQARAAAGAGAGAKAAAIGTRAVGQVAPIAPIDFAIGAGANEENPVAGGLTEIGLDLAGTGVIEAGLRGLRARKLQKLQTERAGRTPRTPTAPEIEGAPVGPELDARLAAVGERQPTAEQQAVRALADEDPRLQQARAALAQTATEVDALVRRAADPLEGVTDPGLRTKLEAALAKPGADRAKLLPFFQRTQQLLDRRAAFKGVLGDNPAGKAFNTPDGGALLVSADLAEKGKWRVTRYDPEVGPTGHLVFSDTDELAQHLSGYKIEPKLDPAAEVRVNELGVLQPKQGTPAPARISDTVLDELGPDAASGEQVSVREMRERVKRLPRTDTPEFDTPERTEQRYGWVQALLQNHGWNPRELTTRLRSGRTKAEAMAAQPERPAGAPKVADIVLGYSAAGKSTTVVDPLFDERPWAWVADADESKWMNDQFMDGANAGGVHVESKGMNQQVLSAAIEGEKDIIYPTIGTDPEAVRRIVAALSQRGYEVRVHLNDVAPETALQRLLKRWRSKGRFLDPSLIDDAGDGPVRSYEALKSDAGVSIFRRWDGNPTLEQGGPRLTEEGVNPSWRGQNVSDDPRLERAGVPQDRPGGGRAGDGGLSGEVRGPEAGAVPGASAQAPEVSPPPATPAAARPPAPSPKTGPSDRVGYPLGGQLAPGRIVADNGQFVTVELDDGRRLMAKRADLTPLDNPATTFTPGADQRTLTDIEREINEVELQMQRAAKKGAPVGHYVGRLQVLRQQGAEAAAAGRLGATNPGRPEVKWNAATGTPKPKYGGGVYGNFGVRFASNLDAAAYSIKPSRGKGGELVYSKAHKALLAEVQRQTGLSEPEIIAHGYRVKEALKKLAREAHQRGEKDLSLDAVELKAAGPDTPAAPKAAPAPTLAPQAATGRQLSPVERAEAGAAQQRRTRHEAMSRQEYLDAQVKSVEGRTGAAVSVETNTGSLPATYAILPNVEVIPSHRPADLGPFVEHPRHPGNERSYAPGSDQHAGVLQQAGQWNPARVLNTDPTPVGGPPIVVPWTPELAAELGKRWEDVAGSFWTAGGNSRVMAQLLLRDRGKGAVVDAANREAAQQFGFDPQEVREGLTVVRLLTEPVTTKAQAQRLVSQLNEVPTKALAVEEMAVSAGARLSRETQDWFSTVYDADKTLRANLQQLPVARELRDRLGQDGVIDASTRAKLFRPDGSLTDEGKTFVERIFLGRAVPDPALLNAAAPSVLNKIEAVATLIARTEPGGEAFDLRPRLGEILRLQGGTSRSLREHLAQLDMLEDPPSEEVQRLWQQLDELTTKELREKLGRYAEVIESRVVNRADPAQQGFGFDVAFPPPTPKEAWDAAFVHIPQQPSFVPRGAVAGSLLGGLQGLDPAVAGYMVRGVIGTASAFGAADEDVDPRLRAILTAMAVAAGGPVVNKALARHGLHPGEWLYRHIEQSGGAGLDWAFRQLSKWRGEGEAYRIMQFISYQYGMPEWVGRALVAREVGIENESRTLMEWVNREIVQKLQPADRQQVTALVRQVEQRRQAVTAEIDRLQALRAELKERGAGAIQQSHLFHQGDPTTDAGLLAELQKARQLREAETGQAWGDIAQQPLAKTARRLVELEDELADRLVAEGFDPRIFERFRGAHLTRAFEKYLDPEQVDGLADALRDPASRGAVRDPAFWAVARQDLDAATRQQLGEITDAAVLFAKGQTDKLHSLFTRRYFTQLAHGYAKGGSLPLIASQPVKASYLKLPNNPALGELAGKYAHPSIGHSLMATYNPTGAAGPTWRAIKRVYGKALGAWKAGKTAWSPMTQARNFMSNAVLLHLSGVDLFDPRNNALFFRALHDYRTRGPLWKEASEAGVFRGGFWQAEVDDLFRAWSGTGGGTPLSRIAALSGTAPKLRRALQKPGDWYQAQEQLFKLVKFAHERTNGANVTQAADEAVRTLFDYSAVPDWVRLYRSSIFGSPFFTFTYKAVPRIAEWTLKNPSQVASLVAVFAAIESLSQKEPLPQVAPELVHPWLRPYIKDAPGVLAKPGVPFTGRQALQLPFSGEKGQALASLDFLLPTGAVMPDAPTPESKLWDAIPPALRPGNPAAILPFELLKNRAMYSDRPIRPEAAGRDGVLSNIGEYYAPYVGRQLAPGVASLFMDYRPGEGAVPGVAVSAAKGDVPLSGLLAHLLGTKPVYMDPRRSATIERQKLDKETDEVKRERVRELHRRKATAEGLTDEGRGEIRQEAKGRLQKIRGDQQAVRDALRRARAAGYR